MIGTRTKGYTAMSENRWQHNGVTVATFTGPAIDDKPDRRRINIVANGEAVSMDMQQWRSLVQYIRLVGNTPHEYYWQDSPDANYVSRDGILVCVTNGTTPTL